MLVQFEALLAKIERRDPGKTKQVFKETSEDCICDLAQISPPPQRSAVDLLKEPPTAIHLEQQARDTTTFEDEGAEYADYAPTISQEAPTSKVLLDLLARDSEDRACQLLQEMKLLATVIAPSRVFEGVVVRVLSNSSILGSLVVLGSCICQQRAHPPSHPPTAVSISASSRTGEYMYGPTLGLL